MPLTTNSKEIPVRIVGSSVFGRYPTISVERTYNMFISYSADGEEEWLVNFAGYRALISLFENSDTEGRGLFHSVRGNFLIAIAGSTVFRINLLDDEPINLGTISGSTGEVFMAENLSSQIFICDVSSGTGYIYNYEFFPAAIAVADYIGVDPSTEFTPNYVSYHNTYFLIGNARTDNFGSQWVVFETGATSMGADAYKLNWVQTLALQTKSDFAKAVIPIPGHGNNVLVLGTSVAEVWNDVGGLAVYQRQSSVNIDYGTPSVSTISANDEVVAWLGINEKSSPSIMMMQGGGSERISTDGIDYILSRVIVPSSTTAFLYRQDGHLFYVLTFFDPQDNFSIMYDFTAKKFYDLTDWDFSFFPARSTAYYTNKTLFLSLKDSQIYELSSDITAYDLNVNSVNENVDLIYEIPRIRITNTFRFPRPENYLVKLFTFVVESGTSLDAYNSPVCFGYVITEDTSEVIYTEDDLPILVEGGYCYTNKPRIDLTISKNGGINFSNVVSYELKATGNYKNQPRFNELGYAQQITYQMRFWGTGRMVIKNGMMEIGK